MDNINNSQASNNATRAQSAPAAKQPAPQQSQAFNKPNIPQQVTPFVQQLVQSAKEGKAPEHLEHLEYSLGDDDFQSEMVDSGEITAVEEQPDSGQRGGHHEQADEDEQEAEETQSLVSASNVPAAVSGGGVTVGSSSTAKPVPDSRIIALHGQNYSVAFLKRQVGNYSNSSFANAAPDAEGGGSAAATNKPWGGATLAGAANQFEAFISASFPNGDPGVPSHPPVRYEGSALVVNGQVYGAHLNDPKLVGSIDSFLVGNSPEHQAGMQQVLGTFNELEVINEFSLANGNTSYTIGVPAEYYGQWQAALMDNLPAGSTVQASA